MLWTRHVTTTMTRKDCDVDDYDVWEPGMLVACIHACVCVLSMSTTCNSFFLQLPRCHPLWCWFVLLYSWSTRQFTLSSLTTLAHHEHLFLASLNEVSRDRSFGPRSTKTAHRDLVFFDERLRSCLQRQLPSETVHTESPCWR